VFFAILKKITVLAPVKITATTTARSKVCEWIQERNWGLFTAQNCEKFLSNLRA